MSADRRAPTLKAAAGIAGVVLLTLLGLEAAIRVAPPYGDASKIMAEIEQGLREREAPRVVVLGDSFSLDYEGSAMRLLRGHLAARGVPMLNLAVGGSGPADYLDQFTRYGVKYAPKLVILNYYVGNDVTDTTSRARRSDPSRTAIRKVLERSYLGNTVLELRGAMTRWWRVTRIRKEMREYVMPQTLQINDSHHPFYRRVGFVIGPTFLTTNVPQDLLGEFCRQRRLRCHDLLPAFRRHRDRELYREDDDHWNLDGNRLAFELIRTEIERGGYLAAAGSPRS